MDTEPTKGYDRRRREKEPRCPACRVPVRWFGIIYDEQDTEHKKPICAECGHVFKADPTIRDVDAEDSEE